MPKPLRYLIIAISTLGLLGLPAAASAAPAASVVPLTAPTLAAPAAVTAPTVVKKTIKKCYKIVKTKSGKKIKKWYACKPAKKKAPVTAGKTGGCSVINGVRGQSGASHRGQNALDFMVSSSSQGNAIFNWARAHWQACKIKYIIWQQRYYGPGSPGGKLMGDRGGPTANHRDHLHLEF